MKQSIKMRLTATNSMILAGVLKSYLEKNGYSIADMLEKTTMSKPTWARLSKGQSKFDVEQLYDVVKTFNLSIVELFSLTEKVKEEVSHDGIDIIPPIPTSGGRLTNSEGVKFVAVAVLAYLALSVMKNRDKN